MTALERMPTVGPSDTVDTPDEPWSAGGCDWYKAAETLAVERLGAGGGRNCLVVGSPVSEVRALDAAGWGVWYVDVRRPPDGLRQWFQCDVTSTLYRDDQFDAVSSTCVLCHVGLGRYGDPVKPNGDRLMLAEIARILRPGGRAVIMAGPAVPSLPRSVVYGNVHRIYRPADVVDMASEAGLDCTEAKLWDGGRWLTTDSPPLIADGKAHYHYLSVVLEKPK